MRHVAQQVAAYGRNGDTTLVHMSEGEVQGLRALARRAGTDLTVNPHTGLPEAFSLMSLLPIAAGFIPGVGPMASIALGAGLGALTSKGNPLLGAVSGGLGAYGGMNLASGLTGAGADAVAKQALQQGAGAAMSAPAADVAAAGVNAGNAAVQALPAQQLGMGAAENPSLFSSAASNAAGSNPMDALRAYEHGYQNTVTGGSGAWDAAKSSAADSPFFDRFKAGAQAWANDPSQAMTGQNLKSIAMPLYGSMVTSPYNRFDNMMKHAAWGNGDEYVGELYYDKRTPVPGLPNGIQRTRAVRKAAGGLAGLPQAGQYLRGPGDGMSDDIPATVHDTGEGIRVAANEFVVPADVVSHLGNGSSDAGAKVLEEMGRRVRHARTGNPQQGRKINPSKFLPG